MRNLFSLGGGILLALLAVVFVLRDAWAWQRAVDVVDSGFRKLATTTTNDHPGAIYLDSDIYYWLNYAKRMAAGETWRVRETHADNAPYGRPVHWSQTVSWLLVLFGKTRQWITGEAWLTALERGSVWINPALLILLIVGLGCAVVPRIGPVPFGLFSIYLVTLGDVQWVFQPLRPGHQSLYCLFGMLTLASLIFGGAGWTRTSARSATPGSLFTTRPLEVPGFPEARRWFLLSGACAAFCLWVSAIFSTMLLGMLFGAALFMAACAPKLDEASEVQIKPELWRWWGWGAGAGSLFFYLLEYFPSHLALFRLEVNGPLYSIAAVAMGESVNQFLHVRYAAPGKARTPFLKGLICLAIVLSVPLAIFLGPVSWHALKDPEMRRLHDFIQEFYSFPRFAGARFNAIVLEDFGIIPLFLILAIALAAFTSLGLVEWAVIWLSFAVTVGMLGLGYLQVRWLGLYAAMNAWLGLVAGVCAWRFVAQRVPGKLRWLFGVVTVALLLIQPVRFAARSMAQVNNIINQRDLPQELANPVLNKRLALNLREREGPGIRAMADPDFVPALQYFGEGSGVAAFYWEDLDGLHAATTFFADTDGQTAGEIAKDHGLTHVIVQEGNRLQTYFYYIATGNVDQEAAKKIFAARLMGSEFELPSWLQTTPALQQIGMQLYTYGGMRFEERWRVYRISP